MNATEQKDRSEGKSEIILKKAIAPDTWATWALFLAAVIAAYIALRTLSAIKRQADIMDEHKVSLGQLATGAYQNATAIAAQGETMKSQLTAMNGQIAAIESQNQTLQESVAATDKIAKATQDSVEAVISKDRARIRIMVQPIKVITGVQLVVCWTENYGGTPAFLKEFRARFIRVPDRDIVPDYTKCTLVAYSETVPVNGKLEKVPAISLEPNEPLTEADVASLRAEKSFLHFYAFATYRDVFERERRATIHIRWYMRWGGTFESMIMAYWDPAGLPEENEDN